MSKIRMNDRSFGGGQFKRLTPEQCQKMHNASLEILERTGARLYDQEAIDLLKKAGAHTIAQDEHTSVVFGMPGEAVKLGAAEQVLPLEHIAERALKMVSNSNG